MTQRIVFLIALTIYLEKGFLVTRDTAADILGCKCGLTNLIEANLDTVVKSVMYVLSCSSVRQSAARIPSGHRRLSGWHFAARLGVGK